MYRKGFYSPGSNRLLPEGSTTQPLADLAETTVALTVTVRATVGW
jgi:hypothetical protein